MSYRQESPGAGRTLTSNEPADESGATPFGGLLIGATFGPIVLPRMSELQYLIRNFVIASVSFFAMEPYMEETRDGTITVGSDGQQAAKVAPNALLISSSVTVNPWEEVIAITSTALGVAGFSTASIVKGLERVPRLLDLSIRLSTWGSERGLRKKELRNRAIELDLEFYEKLQRMKNVDAARTLASAIKDTAETSSAVRTVEVRPISEQEVDERRQRTLRIVRDSSDLPPL